MRMLLADSLSTSSAEHLGMYRFEEGGHLTCAIELSCGCDVLKGQGAGISEGCLRNARESDDAPSERTPVNSSLSRTCLRARTEAEMITFPADRTKRRSAMGFDVESVGAAACWRSLAPASHRSSRDFDEKICGTETVHAGRLSTAKQEDTSARMSTALSKNRMSLGPLTRNTYCRTARRKARAC